MAVVAVVCVSRPEGNDGWWPNGVYMCSPVLTAGKWRWLAEITKDGILVRRTIVHLWRQ